MTHNLHIRGATTIDTPSDGATLPTATIHVVSTAGPPAFAGSGTITVNTTAGPQQVAYTGTTGTTFTGCSGGTGTMHTGYAVADGWQNITRTELAALDAGLRSSVNGVDGGTGVPTAAIDIEGSGGGLFVVGPTTVQQGATLTAATSGGAIQMQDGDYPVIDPVGNVVHASRTYVVPCATARGQTSSMWTCRRESGAIQAYAPMFDLSDSFGMRPAIARMHLPAHNKAKLTSVAVHFRVGAPHAAIPATMPAARVYAVDVNGNPVLLTSQAAGADVFGYIYAQTPPNPTAWFNGGAMQTLTIPVDQFNVIDRDQFDYIVELVDEQGLTGWPWQLTVLQPARLVAVSNQSLSGAATIDGAAIATGDRILLSGQNDPTQNGVWIANASGNWARSLDLSKGSQFSRGLIVPITSGSVYSGLYMQANTLITSWSRGTSPDSAVPWTSGASLASFGGACIPSAAHANGYWFTGVGTGTPITGGVEPAWPVGIGSTVVDNPGANQITWTCQGPTPTALFFSVKADVAFPSDATGLLIPHGLLWQDVQPFFAEIQDFRPQ